MGEIVNLRRVRKQRARADAAREAEQARLSHGRGKAERRQARAIIEAQARVLDGARVEDERHLREGVSGGVEDKTEL
ncbi:hypothetical protein AA103196_2844 [Ameyamaea chiangmaiensis NBRC 103196]|uniref:DUF4169 family protein n=1 Tax=Ameyamaea chiangmaiensis TaxID=442969 RepID=A0A850PGG3_9PROT|nr:DUF4169 family protein [Ameyamaea chiangmaiensis]MBS4074333.1 DUF4169 family protein [Ameyamaea chiangmaiensis]NVN41316.1 DUF4169 family protein [Ameyamaea chiangmaiensis]GBQ71678.1 hypothetical protein AA103196_2844 [Ameyamaea chiangmaiensis NBRC 103196]